MTKNMPVNGKPKIWCPKEDYQTHDGDGISMSTTSGSSSWKNIAEIETVMYQGTRVKQRGNLFVLEPSRMVIVDSRQSRYRLDTNNLAL